MSFPDGGLASTPPLQPTGGDWVEVENKVKITILRDDATLEHVKLKKGDVLDVDEDLAIHWRQVGICIIGEMPAAPEPEVLLEPEAPKAKKGKV